MAFVCFLIGIVLLLGFAACGFVAAGYLSSKMIFLTTLGLDGISPDVAYIVIAAVFVLLGLLLFLNWFILGMNCRKIKRLSRRKRVIDD